MKRTAFLIILSGFILFSVGAVFAQDDNIPDPGRMPDSSFYFLKSWKESIQMLFTSGAENKARQYFHLSEVRLAEYQRMIEKDKLEIAVRTLKKYEAQLGRAIVKLNEAKEEGKDVKQLENDISERLHKHQEVLQRTLEKVPVEARFGIQNAIDNSLKETEKSGGSNKSEIKTDGQTEN